MRHTINVKLNFILLLALILSIPDLAFAHGARKMVIGLLITPILSIVISIGISIIVWRSLEKTMHILNKILVTATALLFSALGLFWVLFSFVEAVFD